jgi:hypothetical protein
MENIKKELQQAIMERFKQDKIATGLENAITEHVEEVVFDKYKGTKIRIGDLDYELFAVKCDCETAAYNFKIEPIRIELIYTIISEIEGEAKFELEKAKEKFLKEKYMGWYDRENITIELWVKDNYYLSIDQIIKSQIDLIIENRIS